MSWQLVRSMGCRGVCSASGASSSLARSYPVKVQEMERWKEIRGKAKGTKREAQGTHFRSEEHIPQCGVICVHLHVNEGQYVRLAVVILGRIFRMAGTCSLISSCCYGACSWGGNCLLQLGDALPAHLSWKSAVLIQSLAENKGNVTSPARVDRTRPTNQ